MNRTFGLRVRSYTLIEVMVVVALLGLLAMMVLPGMGGKDADRAQRAAILLVSDIQRVRAMCLSDRHDPALLVFSPPATYYISRASNPVQPVTNLGDHAVTHYGDGRASLLGSVIIQSIQSLPNQRLEYSGVGSLKQVANASIQLRCGAAVATITIDAVTGGASIEP